MNCNMIDWLEEKDMKKELVIKRCSKCQALVEVIIKL